MAKSKSLRYNTRDLFKIIVSVASWLVAFYLSNTDIINELLVSYGVKKEFITAMFVTATYAATLFFKNWKK